MTQIDGTVVDLIPFGAVESPVGSSAPPPGTHAMNVHGFQDVFRRALLLPIPSGASIRLPTVAGYAVLKLHAWLDRSQWHDYKDGPDLALAVEWTAQDIERLYSSEWELALVDNDYDLRVTAAQILGADMRGVLSAAEVAQLAKRVAGADRDLLAGHFAGSGSGARAGPDRRREVAVLLGAFNV